jgi:hypothetical protein
MRWSAAVSSPRPFSGTIAPVPWSGFPTWADPSSSVYNRPYSTGEVYTVVVYRLDSISRSTADGNGVIRDGPQRGARLVSVSEKFRADSLAIPQ